MLPFVVFLLSLQDVKNKNIYTIIEYGIITRKIK